MPPNQRRLAWPTTPQHSHDSSPQLNASTSNPPHLQHRRHSLHADSASTSRALVVTTPSEAANQSLRGDTKTYHLGKIGAHTKSLIGKASRGFASLLLGTLGRVVNTVDNSDNDREIDPSQGGAEHYTLNDDDLPLDSPRSSVTAITWSDVEHDTTRLFGVNSSTNVAHIGGNSQSLAYCVTCRRSLIWTSSIQSGSSRSSDHAHSQQDRSVNPTATLTPSAGTTSGPCLPTAPGIANFPDQATPSYNSPTVDMPSGSRRASSLTPSNSVVPPVARIIPHTTGQHYSVRQPPSTPSRITIGTSYRYPPTIEHSRLAGTPASLLHQFV